MQLNSPTANGNLTEEFTCAQFLDGLPEVEFWVRNLLRGYEATDYGPQDGTGNHSPCKRPKTGSIPISSAGSPNRAVTLDLFQAPMPAEKTWQRGEMKEGEGQKAEPALARAAPHHQRFSPGRQPPWR